MKKLTAILFSAFYLLATVGVAFNVHYCGGQVGGVSLYANEGSCCCGEAEAMDDCCDNEQFFFQLDQEQKLVKSISTPSNELVSAIATLVVCDILIPEEDVPVVNENLKFPIPHKQPAWLLNCSLTYYG